MRLIIQRVSEASVTIDGTKVAEIKLGVLVFAGMAKDDSTADADFLAGRLPNLRIFPDPGRADAACKMNLDLKQVEGSILVVPNFTLYGDCRRGRRPDFNRAARPESARSLFDYLTQRLRESGLPVCTGIFGAHMTVTLSNDGPVTFLLDSR
jgi:D-aminoacyl-tRNA deacylase